ncbi:hypothetical protein K491DRAFT_22262 [Lophiostoma macrostomum CBS 122681]|uniref:DUF6604 domain-containing protein n=1 Tax=Lophiostoma macrostomum CBS 122681 TaxID=1314788 RepID=A0A6A6SZ55_9PLEO|nr:hypothetical protein K491DRAFT_22262 [Lophiostoma macrostomum CBS 122681]
MSPRLGRPGGLSPSLRTRYLKYKADTAIVIDWLVLKQVVPTPKKTKQQPTRLAVREILCLAEDVARRAVEPPAEVRTALDAVLVNRRFLTKEYEKINHQSVEKVAATDRHKHFNETLSQAYDLLFPSNPDTTASREGYMSSDPVSKAPTNRFKVLSDLMEDMSDSRCFKPASDDRSEHESISQQSSIQDDSLDAAIAIHVYIVELEGVISTIKDTWKAAAEGSVSITLAGWLTNFGFELMRVTNEKFCGRFGDNDSIIAKYVHNAGVAIHHDASVNDLFEPHLRILGESSCYRGCSEAFDLMWPHTAMCAFRKCLEIAPDLAHSSERRGFATFFRKPIEIKASEKQYLFTGKEFDINDEVAGQKISNDIHQHFHKEYSSLISVLRGISCAAELRAAGLPNFQKHKTVPLMVETAPFLKDETYPISTHLVMGFNVLFQSSKSFLWMGDDDTANKTNCRIEALRLANEIKLSLDELMQCGKDDFVAGSHNSDMLMRIVHFSSALRAFALEPLFDIYYQCPWVAGSQMSAMLGEAQQIGMHMLDQKGIFGGVLHLYNMIRQVGVKCPKVPILEALCDLFCNEVFMDRSRPSDKFSVRHQRFLGGRLERLNGRGWACLSLGRPKEDMDFTKQRINGPDVSLFVEQHEGNDALWGRIAEGVIKPRHSKKSKGITFDDLFRSLPLQRTIRKAGTLVEPEFFGTFPVAKINCFRVYKMCLEIWKAITIKYCAPGGIPKEFRSHTFLHHANEEYITSGITLHRLTAIDVDKRMQHKDMAAKLKKHSSLRMMRDAIVGVCGDQKLEEFLWKGV